MDRNEAIFPKLGATDAQDALLEVDILTIKAYDFPGPQARAGEQPDDRVQRVTAHRELRRDLPAGPQQSCQFLVLQNPHGRDGSRTREHPWVQRCGPGIEDGEVVREVLQDRIPSLPDVGRDVAPQHEGEDQSLGQWSTIASTLDEMAKGSECGGLGVERIT